MSEKPKHHPKTHAAHQPKPHESWNIAAKVKAPYHPPELDPVQPQLPEPSAVQSPAPVAVSKPKPSTPTPIAPPAANQPDTLSDANQSKRARQSHH